MVRYLSSIDADLFDDDKREWLIDGLIEERGSLLLIAEEGQGKSSVAVAAAAAIVTDAAFFGRAVQGGAVIYLPFEKAAEASRRLRVSIPHEYRERIAIGRDVPVMSFATDEAALVSFVEEVERLEERSDTVKLIVVDTAGRAIGVAGADENSTADTQRFAEGLDRLRERIFAAVLVVHHMRRGEGRARGSQALPAWADVVARIERTKAGRILEVIKSNVGAEGLTIPFGLEARPINPDDASAGTVGIAVPAASRAASRPSPSRPLSGDQALALAALTPHGSPITLEEWRKRCVSAWKKPNTAAFRVAWHSLITPEKSRLLTDGLIAIEGRTVRALAGVSEALGRVSSEGALGVSDASPPYRGRETLANAPQPLAANAAYDDGGEP